MPIPLRPRAIGIRSRLIALALIALGPAIVLATLLVMTGQEYEAQVSQAQVAEEAQQLLEAVNFEQRRTIAKLEVLGLSAALSSGDLREFDGVARRVLAADPGWRNIVLMDAQGRQLLNARVRYGQPLPALNRPDLPVQAALTGRPVVSDMARAVLAGNQLTAVYVPVETKDAKHYVLAAAIEPPAWNELLKGRLSSPVRALLLDASGTLVTASANASDDFEADAFSEPVGRTASRAMIERRVASLRAGGALADVRTSSSSQWSVVAYIPRDVLAARARDSRSMLAVGAILLLVFGTTAAVLMGSATARSITELVASVKAVAAGSPPLDVRTNLLEVRQANEVLTGVAAQLAEAVRDHKATRARLEEADRAKNDFLALLAHELRNPLSVIRNGLEVARRTAPADDPRLGRALAMVDRQSSQMTRLVNDLLDVSRIEQRKLEADLQPIDLCVALRAVAEDHAASAIAAHVDLQLELPESPVIVHGDAQRIGQLFGNLVHNALKFTPAGGTVKIRLETDDGNAVASVRDSGAGIQPAMLQAIFDPFVQADQEGVRTAGGIGLGLALVRGLVELHQGTVEAHSSGKGQGAEFVVRLPLAA